MKICNVTFQCETEYTAHNIVLLLTSCEVHMGKSQLAVQYAFYGPIKLFN